MRPLFITEEVRAAAAKLKAHAEAHVISNEEMQKRCDPKTMSDYAPIGDDPNFVMYIPVGFRVVYTQEVQNPPLDLCHHLSVSVDASGRAPNIPAMDMILELFGIKKKCLEALVRMEYEAVNVIVPVNEAVLEH